MRALENECKGLLSPLILGEEAEFDADQARVVAAWAAKTAMVLEFTGSGREHPTLRTVPSEHRTWLMERQEPPPHTRVWFAQYEERVTAEYWHSAMAILPRSELQAARPELGNTHITGLALGKLFLLTLGTTVDYLARLGPPEVLEQAFTRLWPNPEAPVTWPPREELSRADFAELFEGYKEVCYQRSAGGRPPVRGLFGLDS